MLIILQGLQDKVAVTNDVILIDDDDDNDVIDDDIANLDALPDDIMNEAFQYE